MLWLQDGVVNEDARRIAADAGIPVVMDDCIKRNVRRLLPPA
jgi:predicted CoA-binding protein